MKTLLLGATGQLGSSFRFNPGLAALGPLISTTRHGEVIDGMATAVADMARPDALDALLDQVRPQIIVNAAAYTAVDRAEQEESLAMRVNAESVGRIGRWAAANDALVVHFSTDYVFDGSRTTPYPTDATTGPLNAYGRSKLAGEMALRQSGANHMIFRTSWVYAGHGQNFFLTMLRLARERPELRVVSDQTGCPTSTGLLVEGTLAALDRWRSTSAGNRTALQGVHHLVASGSTSWHGFAVAIFEEARQAGLLPRIPTVIPIGSSEYPTPAERPAYAVLDNTGFTRSFGMPLPGWRTGLRSVIRELAWNGLLPAGS